MFKAAHKRKVLILEDDPLIAWDLEIAFHEAGFEIIGPVATVDEAIALIIAAEPDCASLDFNIGELTSLPVARMLEKFRIPFVIVSGRAAEIKRELGIRAARILDKPIDSRRVVEALAV